MLSGKGKSCNPDVAGGFALSLILVRDERRYLSLLLLLLVTDFVVALCKWFDLRLVSSALDFLLPTNERVGF